MKCLCYSAAIVMAMTAAPSLAQETQYFFRHPIPGVIANDAQLGPPVDDVIDEEKAEMCSEQIAPGEIELFWQDLNQFAYATPNSTVRGNNGSYQLGSRVNAMAKSLGVDRSELPSICRIYVNNVSISSRSGMPLNFNYDSYNRRLHVGMLAAMQFNVGDEPQPGDIVQYNRSNGDVYTIQVGDDGWLSFYGDTAEYENRYVCYVTYSGPKSEEYDWCVMNGYQTKN